MRAIKGYFSIIWLCIWLSLALASSTIEEEENEVEENYRLPNNHVPQKYDLNLKLNPESDIFSGQVIITFETINQTNFVFLHASLNRIKNIKKLILNSAQNCEYTYPNRRTEILKINCTAPIRKGENKLLISYDGVYSRSGTGDQYFGLFKSSYQTAEGIENYAVTQFQTVYARMAFPCFDEPRFKAVFEITVSHPERYTVQTNTEITSEIRNGRLVITKFQKTPPISTYLIAFAISTFKRTSDNSSTPNVNFYTRPSQSKNTALALSYVRNFVEALGNWTGITYEDLGINKLDIFVVPQFTSEAMENWGLITFQEDNVLEEGHKTSAEDKNNILFLLAHELAHHWFGNYVTMDWWSNTWLNEGFATFMQYMIPDMVDKLNLERLFVPLNLHLALEEDSSDNYPLSNSDEEVQTRTDIGDKFDTISYEKGASIIRMMSSILGYENFRKGVQSYLKKNAHKNTNPKMLLDDLGEFYEDKSANFSDLMNNWIYKPGYPIVKASLNVLRNKVEIIQEEFPGDIENQTLWHIPITYTTSEYKNFNSSKTKWLHDEEKLEVSISNGSWIILNLQQMGYYRVNYDDELWRRIISVLKSDEMENIHVSNRAQLIDDAFTLAEVDKLDFSIAFELISYLEKEIEYEPWYAAATHLKYVNRLLEAYAEKDALKIFKTIVLRWINRAFPHNKEIDTKDHFQLLTNQVIYDLKCNLDDDDSLQNSQKVLKKYKKSKTIDDYNTRNTALCYGLKTSKTPEDDYTTLLAYYNQSDSPIERKSIISSLGCISNSSVIRKYLFELLSDNTTIARPDLRYMYIAITSNTQAQNTTLSFLNDHLKEIYNRHSDIFEISELILHPAKWIVLEEHMTYLTNITNKYQDIEGMADYEVIIWTDNKTNRKNIKSALENISLV